LQAKRTAEQEINETRQENLGSIEKETNRRGLEIRKIAQALADRKGCKIRKEELFMLENLS